MNIIQQFRSAIKRGTGETHILLKENPKVDFSKEIIKACRFNYAYDRQCEGVRDVYLSELIEISGKKDTILAKIYDALMDGDNDADLSSLSSIATIFAKRGDEKAKEAVYKEFRRETINNGEWYNATYIIEIDGLQGLIYVAEIVGEALLKNPDASEDSWFVDNFQEENLTIDVYTELKSAAETNVNIKKYLQEIEAYKPEAQKRERPVYNYEYFKQKIDDKPQYFGFSTCLAQEQLTDDDTKRLADDFLKETRRAKQQKYLSFFSQIEFPYGYQSILRLAKGKHSTKNRFIQFAVDALQFFTGNDIRQFALDVLAETKTPDDYVSLLVSNYQEGDWQLLKSIAEKAKNQDVIHSLATNYLDIYRANPVSECKEPLEVIYNKMTCGIHRRDLVKVLIDNNVLSDKIRNEIQFDSDENTRKLYFETTPNAE